MKQFFLLIVLSVILAQASGSDLAAQACQGSITHYAPAVVGDGGDIVSITIHLVPGSGNIYMGAYPRSDTSTQESVELAVDYAYLLAGKERNCDVIVDFKTPYSADYVEGPSAGAALATMTYALIENRTLRQDTIMTGTIGPSGSVGPVGGLYEKMKGAASKGAKYFITPVENIYEMFLLKNAEATYGITVLQATTVEEIIGFMTQNLTINQNATTVKNRSIPDLPPYDASAMQDFVPVAQNMIDYERDATAKITGNDEQSVSIRGFFENEAKRQAKILEQGYLFGAANEAFLNYIDISTINAVTSGNVDLEGKKTEISACLFTASITRPPITDENFEWVVGADLREAWALGRLNSTNVDGETLKEEKYILYNELEYAEAWCLVSKELLAAAPVSSTAASDGDGTSGKQFNESIWKDLARSKLAEAEASGIEDPDLKARIGDAESSFARGKYGAAIYDAVYVIEMENADMEIAGEAGDGQRNMTGEEGGRPVGYADALTTLLQEKRTSLWGRIYQSQGAFLQEQNQSASAYSIARYAKALDDVTLKMKAAIAASEGLQSQTSGEGNEAGQSSGQGAGWTNGLFSESDRKVGDIAALLVPALAIVSIFLLIGVLIMLARRLHGRDNGKRSYKANRAKQKEGGARVQEIRPRPGGL